MSLLTIHILISFLVGAGWITVLTVLGERYGTRIGGVIAGIPATLMVSLFFIGISQSPEVAAAATTPIPLVVGVNALFVVIYIVLAKTNWLMALISALAYWGIVALFIVRTGIPNFAASFGAYVILAITAYMLLEHRLRIASVEKRVISSPGSLSVRAILGGGVIAIAVYAAKVSGPLLGGVLATFPALTVALIIILESAHGRVYTAPFLKSFIISGKLSVLGYVLAVRYGYPEFGIVYGTFFALGVSAVISIITYRFLILKLR